MQRVDAPAVTKPRRDARRPAAVVALVLVIALFSVLPLAEATPPDQTWIAGLYDNADQDDVVILITGMTVVHAPPAAPPGPMMTDVGCVRPLTPRPVAERSPDCQGSRAPPRSHA